MPTPAEENYLKAIFKLSGELRRSVSTNDLAEELNSKASSVTDMLKKLHDKKWVKYQPYQGAVLSRKGHLIAANVVRKHRLWEVFLVETLNFKWDEIHDIAEQLEHIVDEKLFHRLDEFLGFPEVDPHGDPIPKADGSIKHHKNKTLYDILPGESAEFLGLKEHQPEFLQYLDGISLRPGAIVHLSKRFSYDQSVVISINGGAELMLSQHVTRMLLVRRTKP
ncbi:MAG: metal-dependent transcriptional regulator [Flavobacteriales bacterium]